MADLDLIILEKITAYQTALDDIQKRRHIWNETVKDLIFNTLTSVKNIKDLDWSVQKVELVNNLQTVNLIFKKSYSGITQVSDNGSEDYLKYGAGLFFSQSYNGNIFVFIEFPYMKSGYRKWKFYI